MDPLRFIPITRNLDGRHEFLWKLLEEREDYVNISHERMPTMVEHIRYIDEDNPYRVRYVLALGTKWIGVMYLTVRNEVGIQICRAHRGEGWGLEALRWLISCHDPLPGKAGIVPNRFVANINPENVASIALFKRLGAELIQHTYQLPERGAANGQIEEPPTA